MTRAQSRPPSYVPLKRHPGIYRRGKSYVVRFRDASGKQCHETVRTLKQALAKRAEVIAARDAGTLAGDAGRVKFATFARDWVARQHGTSPETRAEYARDLEARAIPYLGGRALRDIRPGDIDDWIAALASEGLAPATVRRILAPVRACLGDATRREAIPRNPAKGATLPRSDTEATGERVRVFTRAELVAILDGIPDDWRPLFEVLTYGGLRWGEVAALHWADVDWGAGVLHIRGAIRQDAKGRPREKAPKSRHGVRDVPLPSMVLSHLRERYLAAGRPEAKARVFPSRAGTPLAQSNVRRRVLAPAAKAAGLDWTPGFHTFRHTFASMHIARGTSPLEVSRLLGHHSAAFTLNTYSHLIPDNRATALDPVANTDANTTGLHSDAVASSQTAQSSGVSRLRSTERQ